jgi:hypothetical protein
VAEVFRFVTVRPPQDVDIFQQNAGASIDLGVFTTTFADTLRALRGDGDRAGMVASATALVESTAFVDSPTKIDEPYVDFIVALRALTDQNFWSGAGTAFNNAFGTDPGAFVRTDGFIAFHGRSSDSIVAAAIVSSVPTKARELLTATARALWLIRRLAARSNLSRTVFLNAPLALPFGIFPLPPVATNEGELRTAAVERAARARDRDRRRTDLSSDLAAHRQAVDELLASIDANGARTLTDDGSGFGLSDEAARRLTDATKAILFANGLPETGFDLPRTVAHLENRSAALARSLHADAGPARQIVRIGNTFVSRSELDGAPSVADPTDGRTPGPCAPVPDVALPSDGVTVPSGHGDAKILGIADLNLVEQTLLRYELGEVAHIQNVLRGETRSRTFRTSHTTEQTDTTETETTQEKEQALSSTEQFELQTESQTVINDNASTQLGLTIHASYGPSVDATSNFNFSSGSSRQQSNAASASFAREISSKAVNRVQTRTLTRRTTTTTDVVEETDVHTFDNRDGDEDIVGVYRFVDKVYRAQVVNYGKRLMLEFLVPEPAAFLRHVASSRPATGVTQVEPDPPGYCLANGTTFQPLQVTDIRPDSYLMWAGKYGAQDVAAPPPALVLTTASKKSPDQMRTVFDSSQGEGQEERKISSDVVEVSVPDGYQTQAAKVNLFGKTQSGKHEIVVQVADQQGSYVERGDDSTVFDLRGQRASTVDVTLNTLAFHDWEAVAVVMCTLSAEKFQDWQLKTFNSIMSAYNDLKSRFDQAVAEARLQSRNDAAITGTNPAINRETEQTELKKGCIALLTGQRFDLFDAVTGNVAPFGFPEMDFAEAKAEGAYIQAFEQSFEWNNMTYIFYPYFWGRKDEWPVTSQLSDDDPLFTRFLRAGAARVQVPVRLGFENPVLTYLSTGELWAGAGTMVNSDGDSPDVLYLSIVDELKSQQGDNNVDGPGTVNVNKNSPNVTGSGTAFSADDKDRRISIGGTTYVIKTVTDEQNIRLTTNYTGNSDTGLAYSMGGKLVGESWEVKLPTNLVKLDDSPPIS